MAEKSFGVKEINLIGASGTPTIESPNNLNLNAVNVAISTNATIGGNLTVSGTVGIAGTLTYEDVTNVDSIGILTARTGVKVLAGGINVVGVSYFNNNIVATATTALSVTAADESSDTSCNVLFSTAATGNVAPKTGSNLTFNSSNGALSATTFSGSGASLTNLPAGNLTGTLPALDGSSLTGIAVTEAPVTDYTISANGSSAYRFHGGGVDETANNPTLYLIRGQKYRFNNTTGSSHPFALRVSSGGSAYTDGVTGSQNGIQFFTVPYAAPASLVYQCAIHSGMVGSIVIRGGANFASISNNADNRVITGGSGANLNGESGLTFDGSKLVNAGSQTLTAGTAPQYRLNASSSDSSDNDRAIFGLATATNHFINGSSSGDTILRTTNSGNLLFGVGTSEKLRIASNGDIGLGTIPETDSYQPSLYFAGGNANIWGSGNANLYSAVNARYTGAGGWKYNNNGVASYVGQQSGVWNFFNAPSGTADATATFTERFRITFTDATIYGATDGVLNLTTTDGRGSFIRFQENGTSKAWVGCSEGLGQGDQDDLGLVGSDKIRFRSNGSQRLVIDSNEFRHGAANVLEGSLDDVRIRNSSSYKGFVLRGTGGSGGMANHDEYCFLFNRMGSDGEIVTFNAQGSQEGSISVNGSSVSYNGGVLSRWSQLVGISTNNKADRPTIYQGTVMSNLDEMCEWADEENMQLNKTEVSTVSGDKNVAGVFWAWDDDDDTYVNDFYIAQTGDYIIRVGAATTVTRGDLLESAGDGTAKPQSDDIVRSKTVAKVTSGIAHTTYPDGTKTYPCVLMGS